MEHKPPQGSSVPRPRRGRVRWTSFLAEPGPVSTPVRALHEQSNPAHRLRVEHDDHTLLIHLGGEEGEGWTTVAVDRSSRSRAVA